MKYVVAASYVIGALERHYGKGAKYLEMPKIKDVLPGLSEHPDMGIFMLGRAIVAEPTIHDTMYKYYESELENGKFVLKRGARLLEKSYPKDIAYNCVVVGNYLIHHRQADEVIINLCMEMGYEMVAVKQGYAKCSTLVVDNQSVITDDVGLAGIYRDMEIDTLLVQKGDVLLEGFEYGFIGGTAGRDEANQCILFSGDLRNHRDGSAIRAFIEERGFEVVELCDGPLIDCGSIFISKF